MKTDCACNYQRPATGACALAARPNTTMNWHRGASWSRRRCPAGLGNPPLVVTLRRPVREMHLGSFGAAQALPDRDRQRGPEEPETTGRSETAAVGTVLPVERRRIAPITETHPRTNSGIPSPLSLPPVIAEVGPGQGQGPHAPRPHLEQRYSARLKRGAGRVYVVD